MNLRTFISLWSEEYISRQRNNLKRARIFSFLVFSAVLLFFVLNTYYFLKIYGTYPFKELDIQANLVKAGIYQLTIIFALLIRLVSLCVNNKHSLRFAELGSLLAFFAWLGYLVWSATLRNEISKLADVNWSSHLCYLEGIFAIMLSVGFVLCFFYKIIFLIVVTWKTVSK